MQLKYDPRTLALGLRPLFCPLFSFISKILWTTGQRQPLLHYLQKHRWNSLVRCSDSDTVHLQGSPLLVRRP